MKKKWGKRIVGLGMAAVLLVGSLAGCGKEPASVDGGSTQTAAGTTVEPEEQGSTEGAVQESTQAELEPVTLTWYAIGNGPDPDHEKVMAEVNKILQEKLNVTLEWTIFDWGSYEDKMRVKIASGEEFDMCYTSAGWVVKYAENVAKGAFLPLTDLLPEYAPEYYKGIDQKYWDVTKINGDIYGAINYQTLVEQRGLVFQKDLLDKYGFDCTKVKTPKDLEPFLEQIRDNEPGITPVDFHKSYEWPMEFMSGAQDVSGYVDFLYEPLITVPFGMEDYKIGDALKVSDVARKAFEQTHEWYKAGFIKKDAASVQDTTADVKAGKYAVWACPYKPGVEAENQSLYDFPVVTIPVTEPTVRTRSVLSGMTAISRTSKNPERCMMVLEELWKNKDLYNLMAFGIEGVHYNKVSDNSIEQIADSGYAPGISWELVNQFNAYYLPGQEEGTWEATMENNEAAVSSPIAGFSFDVEPVKTIIANINSVYEEMYYGLYTGMLDLETAIPQYEEKLKTADPNGELTKEAQKQLDAWAKVNGAK